MTGRKRRVKPLEWRYMLMLLPGVLFILVFNYIPMGGIVIAFQKFWPAQGIFGSEWVGLRNFEYMFELPDAMRALRNTVIIAVAKILAGLVVPVVFALLLNEVRKVRFKRTVQTLVYLPHFLSWVILASILNAMMLEGGIIQQIVTLITGKSQMILASNAWFRPMIVITDQWKEFGFGTIIYLAAITNINPSLYESASIDGATRFQKLWYVTLPGMAPTIVLMLTLSLGNVLNAGFDQIFNMYNPLVYESVDILDTYVYRIGLISAQFGLATAVGLLKSVVSTVLIVTSYRLADKFAGYRIF